MTLKINSFFQNGLKQLDFFREINETATNQGLINFLKNKSYLKEKGITLCTLDNKNNKQKLL